jgi:hypothetical protein
MQPDCFKLSVRCGVEALPPESECPSFPTLAEQAVLGALERGTPVLLVLTARQGTGKSFLALRLYERLIEEGRGALPAVLCGSERLVRDFERELFSSLSKALYDALVARQRVRRRPEDAGIADLRQLSYVLEVAGLRVFLTVDEAHLVPDLARLMDKIRELEGELQYAGILLTFQDLPGETRRQIEQALIGRGGTRFAWEGLTERHLLPTGDVVKNIRSWAERELGDAAAAAVYAKLAEVYGFRAANHFVQHLRSPRPASGDEGVLSDALVRALAKRYGLPHDVPVGRCKADLVLNGQALDVKICGDPSSLRRAVEDDLRRGCDMKYVVVGRCRAAVPQDRLADIVETDAASLAYAVRMAAESMKMSSIIDAAAEALAELVDLSRLGARRQEPDKEKVKSLLEQLCLSLGSQDVTRSDLLKKSKYNKFMRPLAATLGIELREASDVDSVVQLVQRHAQEMGLPYYLRLVSSSRVKCERRQTPRPAI